MLNLLPLRRRRARSRIVLREGSKQLASFSAWYLFERIAQAVNEQPRDRFYVRVEIRSDGSFNSTIRFSCGEPAQATHRVQRVDRCYCSLLWIIDGLEFLNHKRGHVLW